MKRVVLLIQVLLFVMLASTNVYAQDEYVQSAQEDSMFTNESGSIAEYDASIANDDIPTESDSIDSTSENADLTSVDDSLSMNELDQQIPLWRPGFSISGKIGPTFSVAGILWLNVGYGGLQGSVELGYHWDIFGLYLNQQFSGNWAFGTSISFDDVEDEADYNEKNNTYLGGFGMTALDFRWFINASERLKISLGFGLGFQYQLNVKKEVVTEYDENGEEYVTEKSDGGIIPLARLHLGINYLMTPNLSLGFRLDYSGFSLWYIHYHQFDPSFFVTYTF